MTCKQIELQMQNAYFAQENAINDILAMVHAPIALPKNPRDVEEAMTMWDWPLWLEAIKKKLENLNSRGTLQEADQDGRAMKTKIFLKYAYTEDYQLKRKARFVVCGFSQIKGVMD